MTQQNRILVGLGILILVSALILLGETLRSNSAPLSGTLEPGEIPIYVNGDIRAAFSPNDLADLQQVAFTDTEEGKQQEGWLLKEVLLLHFESEILRPDTHILISSSSNGKQINLLWNEIENPDNMIMFDLSGRGTLKLVSKQLERLDSRGEWVQDVDKIEVLLP